MMRFKYIIAVISQFNLILLCMSLENLGENCNLRSGESGICKLFPECPAAREDLKQGIRPISCGFDGFVPIVCCPIQVSSTTESLPVRENLITAPGEAATFWCEKYLEICGNDRGSITLFGRRLQRDASPTEVPDYEEFGTTEIPYIETTTVDNPVDDYNAIVGGVDAIMDEFPHMAAIGYGNESSIKWLCGGSLISEKFVLTAAHCLFSRNYGPAQWIRLGAQELHDELRSVSASASRGQTHRVMRRIRHPGYRPPSKYHDVALIEIGPTLESNPFSLMSKAIHPACLQVNNETNMTHAVATGWGRLGHYDDVSAKLQKVELGILNKSICNETYQYEIKWSSALKRGMDESVICSGDMRGGKDTCIGDSGGPLQISLSADKCKYRVIGITSFGKVCGFTNSPAVYMSVSYYIPWIESIVWN